MKQALILTRRSFLRAAGAGVAMAFTGSGLSKAQGAVRSVNVFMGTTPDYANVWVAQLNGFFAKENLEAKIRLFPSGAAATDGFRAGVAEFVCCGDIPAMRLWETMGTKFIAPVSHDFYSPVMVVKSAIKTADDLKGKTIATRIGSSFEQMVAMIYGKLKLPPGSFKVINMEPTDMVITLDKGDIDGYIWASPFDERSKQMSGDRVRVFLRGQDVGFPNVVGLVTRADVIKNDSAMAQRFVKALIGASDWCVAHKEQTSEIVAKAIKLELPMARVTQRMDFTTRLVDKALFPYYCELAKFVVAKGIVKTINWDSYFDTQVIRNVDPARVTRIRCG